MNHTVRMMSRVELNMLAQEFLAFEAKLLDERRFREWFALLDDSFVYHVPLREARMSFADEVPSEGYRIHDTKSHIENRIKRLESGAAWSETPPSRTLRVVGSVLVREGDSNDLISVESALLLYRQRGTEQMGDVLAVRRNDVLRLNSEGLMLYRRNALIADTTLLTPNLGVFL